MSRLQSASPPSPRALAQAARLALTLAALLGMASFAGCGKRAPTEPVPGPPPPSPAPSDTAAIDAAIAQSGLDADGLFPLGEVSLGDGAQLTTSAAVTTLAFRRTIPRSDYANTYEFSNPDTAGKPRRVVSLRCKYQKGKLQLVHQLAPQDPTPGDSSDRLVDKVMNADWMRTIELRRDVPTGGWRVTAASEVFLLVDDHRTCADCHAWIEEVRLQSGTVDVTLRDNDLTLDSLIHLGADAPATVTARSRNDVHVVLLHDASGSHVLPRVAPNHFSGAMAVGAAGLRHLTVEALSDSSLFDDRAPVSQHGWTFHYVVNP